jgi:ubiquinone/menaquinone biosynthesis C-methylase UbiE
MTTTHAIPVIARRPVSATEPEYRELTVYESGDAENEARAVQGRHAEPWLNVLDERELGSPPAIEFALAHRDVSLLIKGRAIDLGAGTCWVTARLSKVAAVDEIVALDMSERFLTDVGSRVIGHSGGLRDKIRFAVGSFNDIPFPAGSFDCAFLVAAIHHSLSPVKTLIEARRVLKSDGVLIVVENPSPILWIRQKRQAALDLSRKTGATEICYTTGELDYMLRHAGFESVCYYPVDGLTRGAIRKVLRGALRALRLENVLRTPVYVIVARGGTAKE